MIFLFGKIKNKIDHHDSHRLKIWTPPGPEFGYRVRYVEKIEGNKISHYKHDNSDFKTVVCNLKKI